MHIFSIPHVADTLHTHKCVKYTSAFQFLNNTRFLCSTKAYLADTLHTHKRVKYTSACQFSNNTRFLCNAKAYLPF